MADSEGFHKSFPDKRVLLIDKDKDIFVVVFI